MLAYAASVPRNAERRSSPNALLAIIAGHVALVAVVMSAKMDLTVHFRPKPIEVTWIRPIQPPRPSPIPNAAPQPQPGPTMTHSLTPTPPLSGPDLSLTPAYPDPGPIDGAGVASVPDPIPMPPFAPAHIGPQLLTPAGDLKPPYPPIKLASGEEAVLKLRLTIDERGQVIAVEPIGRADRVFLTAARRHLLAHWLYKPASEDGRAVGSTIVITLRFQLDG